MWSVPIDPWLVLGNGQERWNEAPVGERSVTGMLASCGPEKSSGIMRGAGQVQGSGALPSLGQCCILSPSLWWEREKLGAQSPEISSPLTRKLLGLLLVITHTQLALPASFPEQFPCVLLKGLSNATYYSDLLPFPVESGATQPYPLSPWAWGLLGKAHLGGHI